MFILNFAVSISTHIFLIVWYYLFVCVHMRTQETRGICLPWHESEIGAVYGTQFSPPTIWAPMTDLRWRGVVVSIFTHRAISPAHNTFLTLKHRSFIHWHRQVNHWSCLNYLLTYITLSRSSPFYIYVQYTRLMSSGRNANGHFSGLSWQVLLYCQKSIHVFNSLGAQNNRMDYSK